MARTFGKMKCSIWTDDEFLALTPGAKVLYTALFSHAGTSYAGVADWRPGRLAKLVAPNATAADVRRLGAALEQARFLVIDEETEEVFVRSFVRGDELYKSPLIMVSSAAAFAAISSPRIRHAYLVELHRLREEFPDARGWKDTRVTDLLRRPLPPTRGGRDETASLDGLGDPVDTIPDQDRHPSGNPSRNPSRDPFGNPSAEGYSNPSGEGFATTTTTTTTTTRAKALVAPDGSTALADAQPVTIDGGLFPAPPEPEKQPAETAQTVIRWWIERCNRRPPERTIGHASREIKKLLEDDGIPAEHVYRGLDRWMEKGLSPSQIANEVNAVMNGSEQARFPLRAVSGGYSTGPTLYRNPDRDAYADNTL